MKKREKNSEIKVKKYVFINFDDENGVFDPRRIEALDQRCPLDKEGVHKNFITITKKQKASVVHLLKSPFITVAGMKACNFIQKRLWYSFFPANLVDLLRTSFYRTSTNTCFRTGKKYPKTEASIKGVLEKRLSLKILQYSQENTCVRVSF